MLFQSSKEFDKSRMPVVYIVELLDSLFPCMYMYSFRERLGLQEISENGDCWDSSNQRSSQC